LEPGVTARGVVAATIAVAGLVSACGSNAPTPPTAPPTGSVSSPGPELTLPPDGSSASPGPSLGLPAESELPPGPSGRLACVNLGVTFPAEALRRPATAEAAADPASIGLRKYVTVEAPPEMSMPRSGWREVARSPASVSFVAPAEDGGWRIATMTPAGSEWTFSEGGNCDLQVQLPEDLSFATWRLDPAHPTNAASTEVRVLGTEGACANGKPPDGRILAPVVVSTAEAVTIALVVRHVPGGADCPANPEFPFSVTLDEPLGTRTLFDGSSFPPQPRT
jgi:hypothetical protein